MTALAPPATADLCDAHSDVRVLAPLFRDFGGKRAFAGRARTLRVHEDNALVRTALEMPGNGDVLVVDGGGSLRAALVGGNLGKLAQTHGWSGIVVHGAVRDSAELAQCAVGIKALAAIPRKSAKTGAGDHAVAVTFASVTIAPGEWVYADEDGIVVSERALHAG
jgi:regulator of ribonuclease activity A